MQWCEIHKSHIYRELLKKYTKNTHISDGRFSIFAPKSRKSAKFYDRAPPDLRKNDPKTAFLGVI